VVDSVARDQRQPVIDLVEIQGSRRARRRRPQPDLTERRRLRAPRAEERNVLPSPAATATARPSRSARNTTKLLEQELARRVHHREDQHRAALFQARRPVAPRAVDAPGQRFTRTLAFVAPIRLRLSVGGIIAMAA
jgi:hypothetical protein